MAEELEDPSHFRLLMSKHGEELGHYSVKERMQALHDFHNLGSIPEGKSQVWQLLLLRQPQHHRPLKF